MTEIGFREKPELASQPLPDCQMQMRDRQMQTLLPDCQIQNRLKMTVTTQRHRQRRNNVSFVSVRLKKVLEIKIKLQ